MISPLEACELARAIYEPVDPHAFERVCRAGGVTCGYATLGGVATFTFAGSECVEDWLRDFAAVPYHHPQLGAVHAGFWHGMGDLFVAVRPLLKGVIAIQGHSLGCAHAALLAGLCAANGIPVAQLCLFAPPRPGYRALRNLLAGWVGKIYAYRNGADPVPLQAPHSPLLPWCDVADLIALDASPAKRCNPFAWHGIDLYLAALKQILKQAI